MSFLKSVIVHHMFNVCKFINHTSIDSFSQTKSCTILQYVSMRCAKWGLNILQGFFECVLVVSDKSSFALDSGSNNSGYACVGHSTMRYRIWLSSISLHIIPSRTHVHIYVFVHVAVFSYFHLLTSVAHVQVHHHNQLCHQRLVVSTRYNHIYTLV